MCYDEFDCRDDDEEPGEDFDELGPEVDGDEGCEDESDWDEREERDFPEEGFEDDLIDGVGFADPGGRSALRAETRSNPRNLPCPTCGRENMLTSLDVARGYQCDYCADAAEGIGGY
jgi:hypothetical protein